MKRTKMTKKAFEAKFPVTFPGRVQNGWVNGAKAWHIPNATPGLYTLDIEHISDNIVKLHNASKEKESVSSRYRQDLCIHKCPSCFNEQNFVYSKEKRDLSGKLIKNKAGKTRVNKMMTFEETLKVVDDAIKIAKGEGHEFESVKFLGPGELLMNPQLFKIIEAYRDRKIQFNIFTKGALLGSDELAKKYQKMNAKELVNKLESYKNVGLLVSFQSFDGNLAENLVTSKDSRGVTKGLKDYATIRERAIENLFNSKFYEEGATNRICIINAPIVPENIEESFDIYKFFIERGTPVVMTPSMNSGKGCLQYLRQKELMGKEEWNTKLVELYAKIYAFNIEKGVQTSEQIKLEGISSYAGAEPCNQVSTGLYVRANGLVQMCPGSLDKETVFANLHEVPLKEIWKKSSNKKKGVNDPHNLINNKCPAKDGVGFSRDFYDRVMQKLDI